MEEAYTLENDPFERVRKRRRTAALIAVLAIVLLAAVFYFLRCAPSAGRDAKAQAVPEGPVPRMDEGFTGLAVYFLDVGQGDCAFLRSPNGRTMLIDAGPEGSFGKIRYFLMQHQVEKLDVVVATHLHSDHIGGMGEVLRHYPVGAFYMPPFDLESSLYADLLSALEEAQVKPVAQYAGRKTVIDWDQATEVRLLAPYDVQYEDENDTSIILRVKYGDTAALFAGDAGELSERLTVKAMPNAFLHANVLKVGHHGSATSCTEKFLDAVRPQIGVISCGKDNPYGLPAEEVVTRLQKRGVRVLRTDEEGTILIALDGTRAWVVE